MAIGPQMAIPLRARGGALPQYEQREGDYAGGAGVSGRLSDTGAELAGQAARVEAQGGEAIAKSVSGLQRPFEQLAGAGIAYIGAYNAQQDLDARRALMEYQTSAMQYQSELEKRKGVDARGTEKNMATFLERQRNELGKKYKLDPRAGRWFNWQTYQEAGRYNSWASEYGHRQLGVEYEAVYKDQMSVASNEVARDPSTFGANVGKLLVLLEQKNVYGTGMTGDREENKRAISDFLASGAISAALGNGDAQRANELFAQLFPYLSEVKKGELNNSIAAALTKELASRAELGETVRFPVEEGGSGAQGTPDEKVGAKIYAANARTGAAAPARSKRGVRLPDDVSAKINEMAAKYGVDPNLAMAVAMQESRGDMGAVSSKGARGIFQLMPATFKVLMPNGDINNPSDNIEAGVKYLAQMRQKYGNVEDVLLAYSWGPGNLDSFKKTGKGLRGQDMPAETRNYVPGVRRFMGGQSGQAQPALVSAQYRGGVTLSVAQLANISDATERGQEKVAKDAALVFSSQDPMAIFNMTEAGIRAIHPEYTDKQVAAFQRAAILHSDTQIYRQKKNDEVAAWAFFRGDEMKKLIDAGDWDGAASMIESSNLTSEQKENAREALYNRQIGTERRVFRQNAGKLYQSIHDLDKPANELLQTADDMYTRGLIGDREYGHAKTLIEQRHTPLIKALGQFKKDYSKILNDPLQNDGSQFAQDFFRKAEENAIESFKRLPPDARVKEMAALQAGLRDPSARGKSIILSDIDGALESYRDNRVELKADWERRTAAESAEADRIELQQAIRYAKGEKGVPPPRPDVLTRARAIIREEERAAERRRQEGLSDEQRLQEEVMAEVETRRKEQESRKALSARVKETSKARRERREKWWQEEIARGQSLLKENEEETRDITGGVWDGIGRRIDINRRADAYIREHSEGGIK